ncbi:MAG TPA: hypothetical protein VHD63_26660 [Ktedonobacteraceae bacterium]|jgi:hypothetical protein|nr:hypothetical protein [Ktedonobacteraceae bacterium]
MSDPGSSFFIIAVLARAYRQRSQLTAEDARWARPALELEEE